MGEFTGFDYSVIKMNFGATVYIMNDKEEVLIKKAQDLWDKDMYQTTEILNDKLVDITKLLVFK